MLDMSYFIIPIQSLLPNTKIHTFPTISLPAWAAVFENNRFFTERIRWEGKTNRSPFFSRWEDRSLVEERAYRHSARA